MGLSVHWGLCPGGSLSGGMGISAQGGLCPDGLCPDGLCPWGSLSMGGGSLSKRSLSRGSLSRMVGIYVQGESLSGRPPLYCKVRGVRILLECILVFGKF